MSEQIVKTYFKCARGDYYFDAIFSTQISSTLTITSHPIQTGADITDHAFENGKELTFQIGMSDVMESINTSVIFDGDSTRSINAYNTLCQLQKDRLPITVVNKFGTFNNLLIQSIVEEDNANTITSLRVTIVMKEIFVVDVESVKVSARPEITDSTNEGSQNAQQDESEDLKTSWKELFGLD